MDWPFWRKVHQNLVGVPHQERRAWLLFQRSWPNSKRPARTNSVRPTLFFRRSLLIEISKCFCKSATHAASKMYHSRMRQTLMPRIALLRQLEMYLATYAKIVCRFSCRTLRFLQTRRYSHGWDVSFSQKLTPILERQNGLPITFSPGLSPPVEIIWRES